MRISKTTVLFVATFLDVALALAGSSYAQALPAAPADKTSGQFYKNIQVLNDIPADDLENSMWFIAGALGVPCQHCHVNAYESDTKQAKLMARKMMKMTREINAANFAGRNIVTCNTCHQGSIQPNGVDFFWGKFNKTPEQIAAYLKERQSSAAAGQTGAAAAQAAHTASSGTLPALPTADEICAKYRSAISAMPIKSVRLTIESQPDLAPQPLRMELIGVPPDQFNLTITTPGGQVRQIVNGDKGWTVTPAGVIPMLPAQIAGIKESPNFLPLTKLNIEDGSQEVSGIEKYDNRTYYVLEKRTPKRRSRYYFDTETGLLRRILAEIITPLGNYPTRIDFADYREIGEVRLATSLTNFGISGGATIKVTNLEVNVAVDPAKFQPPAPAGGAPPEQLE